MDGPPTPPVGADAPSGRVYFAGLDGVRAIAVLMVIAGHIEGFRDHAGVPNHNDVPFLHALAPNGVVLFFTLSGFLITYLLLVEHARTGTIHVKHFLVRRCLRIWPIYYLIVALGFFVLPYLLHFPALESPPRGDVGIKLTLFLVLLPNVVFAAYGHILFLGPLWSIGVEEQFYVMWPFLLRLSRGRWLAPIAGGIAAFVLLRIFQLDLVHYLGNGTLTRRHAQVLFYVLASLKMEAMLVGALFAWLLFTKHAVLTALYSRRVQVLAFVAVCVFLALDVDIKAVNNVVYAALFATIIVNLAGNPSPLLTLRNPVLLYLGRISYGMYIYHSIGIVAVIQLLQHVGVSPSYWSVPLYIGAPVITIAIAHVSYRYFELQFLQLKERFAKVPSKAYGAIGQDPSDIARTKRL